MAATRPHERVSKYGNLQERKEEVSLCARVALTAGKQNFAKYGISKNICMHLGAKINA